MKCLICFFVATFWLLFVGCQNPVNSTQKTGAIKSAGFVALSLTEGFASKTTGSKNGVRILGNENAFNIAFSKDISVPSLLPNWSTHDGIIYQESVVNVVYNGKNHTVSIDNVGTFGFSYLGVILLNDLNDFPTSGNPPEDQIVKGEASLYYSISNRTLTINLRPGTLNGYCYFTYDSTVIYTPSNNIVSSINTPITTDFKPTVTTN